MYPSCIPPAASVSVEGPLRHVAERQQELLISAKQYWGRLRFEIEHEPDAPLGSSSGPTATPIRFGNVSAQPSFSSTRSRPRAPEVSSCSELPVEPVSARQQDVAIERDRLRSNQPGFRQ